MKEITKTQKQSKISKKSKTHNIKMNILNYDRKLTTIQQLTG